jgi:hypothetical protein
LAKLLILFIIIIIIIIKGYSCYFYSSLAQGRLLQQANKSRLTPLLGVRLAFRI